MSVVLLTLILGLTAAFSTNHFPTTSATPSRGDGGGDDSDESGDDNQGGGEGDTEGGDDQGGGSDTDTETEDETDTTDEDADTQPEDDLTSQGTDTSQPTLTTSVTPAPASAPTPSPVPLPPLEHGQEICNNGNDDDDDGSVDEQPCNTEGQPTGEICDNDVDEDEDGEIDDLDVCGFEVCRGPDGSFSEFNCFLENQVTGTQQIPGLRNPNILQPATTPTPAPTPGELRVLTPNTAVTNICQNYPELCPPTVTPTPTPTPPADGTGIVEGPLPGTLDTRRTSDTFISGPKSVPGGSVPLPNPVLVPAPDEEGAASDDCITIPKEQCNFPYPISQDEICRNGEDDNGNGRVDEVQFGCTTTSDSAPECMEGEEGGYFATQSEKRVWVPPCEIVLKPEQAQGGSVFGPGPATTQGPKGLTGSTEICGNGIDDDRNGKTDSADFGCMEIKSTERPEVLGNIPLPP